MKLNNIMLTCCYIATKNFHCWNFLSTIKTVEAERGGMKMRPVLSLYLMSSMTSALDKCKFVILFAVSI